MRWSPFRSVLAYRRKRGLSGHQKDEYYTLKAETASRSTELEARLSQSSKQLEHYEMIEAEL